MSSRTKKREKNTHMMISLYMQMGVIFNLFEAKICDTKFEKMKRNEL